MGMLATVINSICLKDALVRAGAEAEVMTAVAMPPFADLYSSDKAIAALEAGKIVIFGAGLGVPFLSTDTAGAVRAAEIKADAMLMAKNIDYIYTDDPRKNPDAKKLEAVKASEVLAMNLKAIDATATAFCLSVGMPIRVFGFKEPSDIVNAVTGKAVGTVISAE
jgi:uridylate kinase